MARIRSVHPGIWTDARFVRMQPLSRLLLIGIWNECDDQGVFQWCEMTLKMRLLAADHVDAEELLTELMTHDFVMKYEIMGKTFGAVRNFLRYQSPKAPRLVHPISPEAKAYVAGSSPEMGNLFGSDGEVLGKSFPNLPAEGEEGNRRGIGGDGKGSGAQSRKTKLPADFSPVLTEKAQALAAQLGEATCIAELEKFKDHHLAKGSLMSDWQAAFRTWLANAVKFGKGGLNGQRSGKKSGWLA